MKTKLTLIIFIATSAFAQNAEPDRFQQLDKNSDGKLTQEEFPYPFFFKRYDKDGDGTLSREEAAEIKPVGGKTTPTPSAPATPANSPSTTPAAATGFKPRPHGDEATKAGLKPDVLAKLDVALQQAVANKEVSGVIGLIHRNGQRGYFEAFGWQDIEAQKPLAKDALFRLQSMTKPVIAACAMSLYDEGRFTLDEPISKHCPEWAEPKVLENGQLVPAKFAITPRMLMSHSSGLYYGDIEKGARQAAAPRHRPTDLKSFSAALAQEPLMFQPGTSYSYAAILTSLRG